MSAVSLDAAWLDANQRGLASALAAVRAALERHADGATATEAAPDGQPAAALDTLCATFGLSAFERQALLLAAGMELDARFPAACASANGDPARAYPTFGLALAALPGAHWSALAPVAPLRRWRLVELDGGSLTAAPLRIDERILHYLAGVGHLDERLAGLVEPVPAGGELVASQQGVAERLARAWRAAADGQPPVVQLCGGDPAANRAVAAAASSSFGAGLLAVSAARLPADPRELDAVARLCEREALLTNSVLLLDCDGLDGAEPGRDAVVTQVLEASGSALLLSGRERRPLRRRRSVALAVGKPTGAEQRELWRTGLGDTAGPEVGDRLVAHFDLGAGAIADACGQARGVEPERVAGELWDACRSRARPGLASLAQLVEPSATWDDLVLPPAQRQVLADLTGHARHRLTVYEDWGMGRGGGVRGRGTSALFAGPSGTGKTLAAEVVAGALSLDLYRIDLSQVVSKYIGETEKNLGRVFDAAEEGGVVLLFDEADALFGKRSEVKDSHDRYANIEVSYLLQRMEAYRGLAVLTTNLREALDPAFLRRIRFVVSFPFPDGDLRAEIWRRAFPPATPTRDLDVDRLARLGVAGGSIRNIAVNAAFLAAAGDGPVTMAHLERAARSEYAKLDKPLTAAEIGGWS